MGHRALRASIGVCAGLLTAAACARDDGRGTERGDTSSPALPSGATPPATNASCAGALLVTSGGIGPVRIGAPLAVDAACTRDTSFSLGEGLTERGLVVRLGGRELVAMLGTGEARPVERLIVTDSAFRTERGIGVGSTVGELRRAHGAVCAAIGEGNVAVRASGLPGVSFAVTTRLRDLPDEGQQVTNKPEMIPDSAKVTRLWVIGMVLPCTPS